MFLLILSKDYYLRYELRRETRLILLYSHLSIADSVVIVKVNFVLILLLFRYEIIKMMVRSEISFFFA